MDNDKTLEKIGDLFFLEIKNALDINQQYIYSAIRMCDIKALEELDSGRRDDAKTLIITTNDNISYLSRNTIFEIRNALRPEKDTFDKDEPNKEEIIVKEKKAKNKNEHKKS